MAEKPTVEVIKTSHFEAMLKSGAKAEFAQEFADLNTERFLNADKNHILRIVDNLQTDDPSKVEAEVRRRDDLLTDLYTSNSFTHELTTNLDKYLPLFDSLSDGQQGAFARFLRNKMPLLALYARNEAGDKSLTTQDYQKGQSGEPGYDWSLMDKAVSRVGATTVSVFENRPQDFPSNLQDENFKEIQEIGKVIRHTGLQELFVTTALHLDISKGGTRDEKKYWKDVLGINPYAHNLASAQLLAKENTFGGIAESALGLELNTQERKQISELFVKVVEYHGFMGQYARGETTEHAFTGITDWARENYKTLDNAFSKLGLEENTVGEMVSKIYMLANIIDTASVRNNLYSDSLHNQFKLLTSEMAHVIDSSQTENPTNWDEIIKTRIENEKGEDKKREFLAERITKLRGGKDYEEVLGTFLELPDSVVDKIFDTIEHAEFWYVENATSDLSVDNQLKLLFLVGKLAKEKGVDNFGNFDVNFAPLMNVLRPDGKTDKVLTKVIDTSLYNLSWEKIQTFSGAVDEVLSEKGLKILLSGENGMTGLGAQLSPEFRSAVDLINSYYSGDRVDKKEYSEALKILEDAVRMKLDEWDRGIIDQKAYQEAMNSTMDRKVAPILPEIEKMKQRKDSLVIVGQGSGTGALEWNLALNHLRRADKVIATDISRVMCEDMKRLSRINLAQRYLNPDSSIARLVVVESDARELTLQKLDVESVDLVDASSIFHELASYLDGGRYGEVVQGAFLSAMSLLKEPGQEFLVRDFLQDDDPTSKVQIKIGKPEKGEESPIQFLRDFTRKFPNFTDREKQEIEDLPEDIKEGDIINVSKSFAMELLAHYSWMKEGASQKEIFERYGHLDESGAIAYARARAEEIGFDINVTVVKEDPGYENFITGRFDVLDGNGKPTRVPMYMASIVMEKV